MHLLEELALLLPDEIRWTIDRPTSRDGSWFLDVHNDCVDAVIEWHPKHGQRFYVTREQTTFAASGILDARDKLLKLLNEVRT